MLGRLATPACTWLEGELAVELFADDEGTRVRVMSEIAWPSAGANQEAVDSGWDDAQTT